MVEEGGRLLKNLKVRRSPRDDSPYNHVTFMTSGKLDLWQAEDLPRFASSFSRYRVHIDQYDNDEKGQQVQRMAAIYKLGSRSTIWLGDEKDDSTHALKLIDQCVQLDPGVIKTLVTLPGFE
jgi:hypothetical protein